MSETTLEPTGQSNTLDYSPDDYVATSLGDLPIGTTTDHPIRDVATGEVLIAGDDEITSQIIDSWNEQGRESVLVHLATRAAWQETNTPTRYVQLNAIEVDSAPDSVRTFVERLTSRAPLVIDFERRNQTRFRVVKPILVIPVDETNQPVGNAFEAITRDLSSGGISFIHTRAAKSDRMVIELTSSNGERKQLAMQVIRCRPWNHFYEIAGKWLAKLG